MDTYDYYIVGDTDTYKGCLITVCGKDKKHAEEVLDRMKNRPTITDRSLMVGHTNIRIEKELSSKCWWNDSFLMSD